MLQIFGPSRKCHDRSTCFAMPPAGFRRHDQLGACLLRHSCTFRIPFCPIWLLFELCILAKPIILSWIPFGHLGPPQVLGPDGTPQKAKGSRFWTRPGVRVPGVEQAEQADSEPRAPPPRKRRGRGQRKSGKKPPQPKKTDTMKCKSCNKVKQSSEFYADQLIAASFAILASVLCCALLTLKDAGRPSRSSRSRTRTVLRPRRELSTKSGQSKLRPRARSNSPVCCSCVNGRSVKGSAMPS